MLKRIRRFVVIGIAAFFSYVYSFGPVYWIVNALGIDSDAVWMSLGIVCLPNWILTQVSPFDTLIMSYWGVFHPPIEGL